MNSVNSALVSALTASGSVQTVTYVLTYVLTPPPQGQALAGYSPLNTAYTRMLVTRIAFIVKVCYSTDASSGQQYINLLWHLESRDTREA